MSSNGHEAPDLLAIAPPSGLRSSPHPGLLLSDSPGVDLIEYSDLFDRYTYRTSCVVACRTTAFQAVVIADTYNYGRALFLDGTIQSAEADEAIYHELLVHPAMLSHPDPRDVLIIGGGEGAVLREVLAHQSVRSVTMVDVDGEVVELCRTHLALWHRGTFDDPRTRLVIQEGREFVEEGDSRYDVVIVDVVDMFDNGPAQALYTRQFYQHLRRRLRSGAVVAIQGLEFSFLDQHSHTALSRTLHTAFAEVHSYRVDVPSFLGSWGFVLASDWCAPIQWSAAELNQRIHARLVPDHLQHLTGEFLISRFSLCQATRASLARSGPLLEDGVVFGAAEAEEAR